MRPKTREEVDQYFADMGATHFCESFYPPQRYWTPTDGTQYVTRVFSVHYFYDGSERGYWIPDMADYCGPHILEQPRHWPEGHVTRPLLVKPRFYSDEGKFAKHLDNACADLARERMEEDPGFYGEDD